MTRAAPGRWAADVTIAVAVTAVQLAVLTASFSWNRHHLHGSPGWAAYLLLGIGGMSLLGRRRYPEAVLAVALGTALWAGAISGAGMIWIVPIAAFFNAVLARRRLAAIGSLVVGYAYSFWPFRTGAHSASLAIGVAAWLLVLLAVAELIRIRRQRAAALARSRQEQLLRQASEERMRMARDIHDVLAHNISVINVQANTALHLMDRQPERAREALTSIHEVSRQALAELRSVLGMLRAPGDSAPTTPSPGLSQLPDLVEAMAHRTGLAVELSAAGDPRQLRTDADVAAYRIVQEALTNTSRHSMSRTARVLVRHEADGLRIQVDDDGPARPERGTAGQQESRLTGGNGITGMTERAEALGGTLSAARRSDGGFRVVAWLPGRPPAAETAGQEESVAAGQVGLRSGSGSSR
jgi:signal transduction histidine kinase